MRNTTKLFLAAALAAVVFTGCANNDAESEAQCKAVKPGEITTVNSMCVIVNEDPVNPAVTPAVWKGQKVGFCCNGCKPKWEALSPAEKDVALAKAVSLTPPKK